MALCPVWPPGFRHSLEVPNQGRPAHDERVERAPPAGHPAHSVQVLETEDLLLQGPRALLQLTQPLARGLIELEDRTNVPVTLLHQIDAPTRVHHGQVQLVGDTVDRQQLGDDLLALFHQAPSAAQHCGAVGSQAHHPAGLPEGDVQLIQGRDLEVAVHRLTVEGLR